MLNKLDQKINSKFEDLKEDIKAPARAPECPICFEELRPPMQIIQCLKGHKLCEPCSLKPEIANCQDGCKAGFMGRDLGMEAFLLHQFNTRSVYTMVMSFYRMISLGGTETPGRGKSHIKSCCCEANDNSPRL